MKTSIRQRAAATLAAVAMAIGGTVALAGPTSAAGVVGSPSWISVPAAVAYDNCADAPYSLAGLSAWSSQQAKAWGNIWGYYTYDVNITVIGPDGTEADTDWVERSSDDLNGSYTPDTGSFFLCGDPGRYVAQVKGSWCPLDRRPETSPGDCKTVNFSRPFTMRAAKTAVSLTGKKTTKARGPKHTLTARVKVERSTGYYAASGVKVRMQYKRGKRWVNDTLWGRTNRKGIVKFTNTFARRSTWKFRAVVVKEDHYGSSKSKQFTVRVH